MERLPAPFCRERPLVPHAQETYCRTNVNAAKKTENKRSKTPLMDQYYQAKAAYPDTIMLFRVGDFYETFGEDAIKASRILGITLTRRANGAASHVELAGFPYHAVDTYLPKLVRAGERVAICEQLEDPKLVKGLVKRGVTELITPGIVLQDNILSNKENTFLAAVCFGRKTTGVAFLDISTGEFYAAEGADAYVDKLLSNFQPKEVIYQRSCEDRFKLAFGGSYYTYKLDEWLFAEEVNREKLCRQFRTPTLKGFGVDHLTSGLAAAGAILHYLEMTEHRQIDHIRSIARIDQQEAVWIDKFTIANLELFASNGGRSRTSFAEVIDRTLTPMGGRLLKRWITMPLRDVQRIERRQRAVGAFVDDAELTDALRERIALIGDLERIASRIAATRVLPRELVQLKQSLEALEQLKMMLESTDRAELHELAGGLDPLAAMHDRIARDIYPDPQTNQIQKGGVIADGVDPELDDLRRIALHGKDYLQQIQQREREATGIPTLRLGYNNVFGYFIEISNAHKEKAPADWVRKQTLANAERYITPELKEYEEKILGAEERMLQIEQRLYGELLAALSSMLSTLLHDAALVARIDCLQSFAALARERRYVRPELDDGKRIEIEAGRHPVLETLLPVGESYIPNDVMLDDEEQQIVMITGPNMSGKSALLRQTALIVLMAQMGSFVPADRAHIGLVDKIFTRVGASDNISQGESTFMVEMLESAGILNNISDRSLVLLDEIGRGTSTYDGISIAWAMVEYLHDHPTARARTLFATHYHELNEMAKMCPRVKNYHVTVREVDGQIVFLRKLEPGGTEHSFGIHVARLAGMPASVVQRAETLLHNLEAVYGNNEIVPSKSLRERSRRSAQRVLEAAEQPAPAMQLSMFQLDDPVLVQIRDRIKGLDINSLTPIEALNTLSEIKRITGL